MEENFYFNIIHILILKIFIFLLFLDLIGNSLYTYSIRIFKLCTSSFYILIDQFLLL